MYTKKGLRVTHTYTQSSSLRLYSVGYMSLATDLKLFIRLLMCQYYKCYTRFLLSFSLSLSFLLLLSPILVLTFEIYVRETYIVVVIKSRIKWWIHPSEMSNGISDKSNKWKIKWHSTRRKSDQFFFMHTTHITGNQCIASAGVIFPCHSIETNTQLTIHVSKLKSNGNGK